MNRLNNLLDHLAEVSQLRLAGYCVLLAIFVLIAMSALGINT